MKLLSDTSGDDDSGIDLAVIDLDPETARRLLARMDQVRALKAVDPEAYRIHYHDDVCCYWILVHDQWGNREKIPDDAQEFVDALRDKQRCNENGWEEITDEEFDRLTADEPYLRARTECDRIEVRDDAVRFACYMRNCDDLLTTQSLSRREIEEAAGVVAAEEPCQPGA